MQQRETAVAEELFDEESAKRILLEAARHHERSGRMMFLMLKLTP